jgi:PAS domain S-box-containing protein
MDTRVTINSALAALARIAPGCPAPDIDAIRAALDLLQHRPAVHLTQQLDGELRAFLDSGVTGILFGDIEGRIYDCNDEFLRIVGYPRSDVLNGTMRWDVITPPEDLPLDYTAIAEARQLGRCTPYEKRYVRRDGTIVHVVVGYTLLEPERHRTVAFVLDLTAQKSAEREARDAAERLRAHVENSPLAVIEFDADLAITRWTPAAERIFGYTAEETVGRGIWSIPWIHPDDLEGVRRISARMLTGDSPRNVHPNRNVHKDGRVIHCQWYNSALPAVQGGRTGSILSLVLDVTERERAEAALRSAGEAFRQLVRGSPFGVYLVDADFRLAEVSEGAARVFAGVSPLIGRDFSEIMRTIWPEPFATDAIAIFRRTLDTGHSYVSENFTERRKDRDRSEAYDWRTERVTMPDGRYGVVCHFYDLTELRAIQDSLQQGEDRLRQALTVGRMFAFEWNAETDVVSRWGEAGALLGLDEQRAFHDTGQAFFSMLHPDDHARFMSKLASLRHRDESRFESDYRIIRPDGGITWITESARGEFDDEGRLLRIVGICVDMTERRKAEQALRESEQRFRGMADTIAQLAWIAEPDGSIHWYNRRWYEYTGTTPEKIVAGSGWDWRSVQDPAEVPRVEAKYRRHIETGEPWEDTFPLRRHDGEMRWHLSRAMPIRDSSGVIVRWFGTNTDIEDQRRARQEIERLASARDELLAREREALARERGALSREREARLQAEHARPLAEQAGRAKDRFLAVLSHELRTPLTPVALTATAMEMDPDLPARFRPEVSMIRRNVELETRLIDDLLDLNRAMTGKLRLDLRPCRLHEIITLAAETVRSDMLERRIALSLVLTAPDDRVEADAARLQQVFWNLLKNAAKFTPESGRVTVTSRSEGSRAIVEVTDTGRGISPESLHRIFEPFEQEDAHVTRRFGGLGLGLAIARSIVELHGGAISARSPGENRGATFSVSLPLCVANHPSAAPLIASTAQDQRKPLRVLLVEDHLDTGRTLERLLRLDGTHVRLAASVANALEAADAESFDVIVSDLGLPDGTGHELVRQLLTRQNPAPPAIALSGYGMEEDIRQSREAGFREHLVKPVGLSQLRDAIQRVARS